MRRLTLIISFFVCLLAGGSSLAAADSPTPPVPADATLSGTQPVVDIITVDGTIDRTVEHYLVRRLQEAEEAGHQVTLQIDSPGMIGVDAAALADRLRTSTVPVTVWVGPAGATAQGGAVLLVEAAGLASVAPGAGVGNLAPLDLRDTRVPLTSALLTDIAAWGAASDRGTALPQIQSRLLTSQNAIDVGLTPQLQADQPAPRSVLEFLAQADGHEVWTAQGIVTFHSNSSSDPSQGPGAVAAFKSLGPFSGVLHSVAAPTAIFVLISLGIAGIAFEVTQPGFGFAGISGVVALALGIDGMTTVAPTPLGILALVGGSGLLVLDVRRKRLGLMSGVGLLVFAASGFLLYPHATSSIAIPVWLIALMTVAAGLYYGFALTVAQQARDRIGEMQMALVGLPGEVRNDLNPVGGVVVKGTVWRARAIGEHVPAGTRIRVRRVEGVVLQVEPDDDPTEPTETAPASE